MEFRQRYSLRGEMFWEHLMSVSLLKDCLGINRIISETDFVCDAEENK